MPKPEFSRQWMRRNPNWTPQETQMICDLQDQGATTAEISHRILMATGITRSASAVANRLLLLGRGNGVVQGRAWTPDDQDELVRLARAGMSASQIAAALGVTKNAVIGRCHRTGVSLARAVGEHIPKPIRTTARQQRKRYAKAAATLPRDNCGRLTKGSAEWIASIPPAKLKTDEPRKYRHPVHIRAAASRFLEWRACNQ